MEEYTAILEAALAQDVGLAALCHSREAADKLRQTLYVARAKAREAGRVDFDSLSFSISPHSAEILYIYKGKA